MPKYEGYDFCGWATRNDLRCSDGRTIRRDAFAHQDGAKVPLVWGHNHDSPEAVLGHGFLENRPDGVFFYGYFNDSDLAQAAKRDVQHGDVTSLSIWANQLKQKAGDVLHGSIKEVSLVLAGANMGAQITYPVVVHGEDAETLTDEAYIYVGEEYGLEFGHSESEEKDDDDEDVTVQDVLDTMTPTQLKVVSYLVAQAAVEGNDEEEAEEEVEHAGLEEEIEHADAEEEPEEAEEEKSDMNEEKTVQDVLDTMDEDQLKVLEFLVGKAAAEGLDEDEDEVEEVGEDEEVEHSEGGNSMNFNAFDAANNAPAAYLSHSDEMDIIAVAKKYGSLKEAIEAFADEHELQHDDEGTGVTLAPVSGYTSYPSGSTPANVDSLFPEFRDVRPGAPEIVTNDQAWVKAVLGKVHKSPFSRIRTSQTDIRNIDGIRAKGYQKGREKVLADNYTVAKRATSPQTVYVKSALNRDDVVDITDFSYVDYQYKIDRMELEGELARAFLIGDGRDVSSADKINEENIRPIWTDNEIFTIHKTIDATAAQNDPGFGDNYRYASAVEEAILDAKIDYRGSGSMDMFGDQEFFNKLLLAKDLNGRRLYANKAELLSTLDVNNFYPVAEFQNKTRTVTEGTSTKTMKLRAIIGNLSDYSMGATKGGEITHFTDFDIDFNQLKSLLETRCSGAITRIGSFIVLEEEVA